MPGFIQFTTEVAPGAGLKLAATPLNDADGLKYVQHVQFTDPDGQAITKDNPLPVYQVQDPAEEIVDADESSVSATASGDHVYTVPVGKSFEFRGVRGSSSVLIKVQVFVALDGSTFVSKFSRFNDRPPGIDLDFPTITIPAGGKVKLTRTNRDELSTATISTTILGELYDA